MIIFGFIIFFTAAYLTLAYRNDTFNYTPAHFKFWLNIEKTKLALVSAIFGATVVLSFSIFYMVGIK